MMIINQARSQGGGSRGFGRTPPPCNLVNLKFYFFKRVCSSTVTIVQPCSCGIVTNSIQAIMQLLHCNQHSM